MPPDVKSIRIDRAVFQQTMEKKLADLPPLPAIVTRIMETVNNPDTSAEDLNKLISMDQGLSSKVLRIVNSS
jgi:HD-like signal output (HDOD) protein